MRGLGKFVRTTAMAAAGLVLSAAGIPAAHADPGKSFEEISFMTDRDGGDFEIYMMKQGGQDETDLSNSPSFDAEPAWNADGTQLAFLTLRNTNFEIWVMNSDGSNQHLLITDTCDDFDPAYSPDGTRIAFSRDCGDPAGADIWTAPADGGAPTQQVTTAATPYDEFPTWSRDSSQIAFDSGSTSFSFDHEIYVVPATGGAALDISNDAGNDVEPDWSPQDRWIAWDSDRTGNDEIWKAHPDGTEPTQLTFNTWGDFDPSWSPSGGEIAWTSDPDLAQQDIYVMNQNGNGIRQLTESPLEDLGPDWQYRDASASR